MLVLVVLLVVVFGVVVVFTVTVVFVEVAEPVVEFLGDGVVTLSQ